MAIRLTSYNRVFIPNISVPTDKGVVSNRDLEPGEQIICDITMAGIGDKSEYLNSYTVGSRQALANQSDVKQYTNLQYERCVAKHCKSIRGLEEYKIRDGKSLVNHEPTPELNDLIQDIFFKVNGIHADDISGEDDTAGELSVGESPVSE